MRNVTMVFLVLLVLATLASGALWKRGMMLGLSRILYRIALLQHASNATGAEEKRDG